MEIKNKLLTLYQQNNQTMENLMTKAHELARQLQADNNIKRYHSALSQAMKILYHNIRLEKEIKTLPNSYKSILVNSKGFLNQGETITNRKDVASANTLITLGSKSPLLDA